MQPNGPTLPPPPPTQNDVRRYRNYLPNYLAAARREDRGEKGTITDNSEELQCDTSDDEYNVEEAASPWVVAVAAEAAVAVAEVATHAVVRGRGRGSARGMARREALPGNATIAAAQIRVMAKRALDAQPQ